MSSLLLPRRFYNQPQGAVALDKRVVSCVLGNNAYDIANNAFPETNTTGYSVNQQGADIQRTGTQRLVFPQPKRTSLTEITVVYLGITPSFVNGNTAWGVGMQDNNASAQWRIGYCSSGGHIQSYILSASTAYAVGSGVTGFTNELCSIVLTWKSGGEVTQRIMRWRDGAYNKNSAATFTGNLKSNTSYRFQTNVAFSNVSGTHSTNLIARLDECVSDEEAESLLHNPYQIFKVSE
jgi:hypothetical protein